MDRRYRPSGGVARLFRRAFVLGKIWKRRAALRSNYGVLRTGTIGSVVGAAREDMEGAGDVLQHPLRSRFSPHLEHGIMAAVGRGRSPAGGHM